MYIKTDPERNALVTFQIHPAHFFFKKKMENPKTLQELISLISNELGSGKGITDADVDIAKISSWMSSYQSNSEDWKQYALW